MPNDQPPQLPIIDAEFEVIEPARVEPEKSWLMEKLEAVPVAFWIIAGLAIMGWARGAGLH